MKRLVFFWLVLAVGIGWGLMVGQVLAGEAGSAAEPAKPASATPPAAEPKEPPLPTPPLPKQPPSPTPPAKPTEAVPVDSKQVEAAILKALAEPSEAEFAEMPLKDVIKYWHDRHKISIVLDTHGIKEIGIDETHPITIHRKDGSFRAILEQVLEPLDLAWTIRSGSLWITSSNKAEEHLVARVYEVADLLGESKEDPRGHLEELIDVITSTVVPQKWSNVGGPGTIQPLILRGKPVLVISHTWAVHLEIMRLLEDLREAAQPEPAKQNGPPSDSKAKQSALPEVAPSESPSAAPGAELARKKSSLAASLSGLAERSRQAETELLEALGKPPKEEVPTGGFGDLIVWLSEIYRIPIVLDQRELKSKGVDLDREVDIPVQNVSLRAILDWLLEPLDLAWTIRHEVIWITSREEAQKHLVARVYSVEELLPAGLEESNWQEELKKLQEVIYDSVCPGSWKETGKWSSGGIAGAGCLESLLVRGKPVLCVYQTWSGHLEVARLLQELTQAAGPEISKAPGEVSKAKPDGPNY
ncbi:MAG: hypothetical protein NZ602_11465 [Thermoguttaceae bacterium]|nr:hypothetical protein [Thermoguttaceae bacterium]